MSDWISLTPEIVERVILAHEARRRRQAAEAAAAQPEPGVSSEPEAAAAVEPEDAAVLLDETERYVRRYVVLGDAPAVAVTLWLAHTHCFAAAEATPYLHVCSAEKASGKTRLAEVLELLAARPIRVSATTAAALARSVSQSPPPSLIIDESDNLLKRDREYVAALLGVLNDGYRRGGKTMLCLPPDWKPSFLPVFSPKVVIGLGELPDTLASRAIRVELKRRAPGEHVERFRLRRATAEAEPLRHRLAAWARAAERALRDAEPELPDELDDRQQDCWEPLLAIADRAGGDWPRRAREAAVALSAAREPETDSLGVRLLADIRDIFEQRDTDRLPTGDLLAALHERDEAPWGDLRGRPLDARGLARLLRPYGVRPSSVKLPDGTTPKGYLRDWFEDAFSRYLPRLSATSATLAQPSQKQGVPYPQPDAPVADSQVPANPHGYAEVAEVADTSPDMGVDEPDEPPATGRVEPPESPAADAERCPVCGGTSFGPYSGACRRCGWRPWEAHGLLGDGGAS